MALTVADRVRETTTTEGTGAFALLGAVAGFASFSSRLSTGDITFYAAVLGTQWEVGIGTLTSATTLTRTTVLASSNGDAAVPFAAGTKDVFLDFPAALVDRLADFAISEATIASAATTDLGAANARKIAISGTAAITSFGTRAHREKLLRFTDACTLTHNATSLILPTGANIVTAAGDTCFATSDASGNWRVRHYQRADGTPLLGVASIQSRGRALTGAVVLDPLDASPVLPTLDRRFISLDAVKAGEFSRASTAYRTRSSGLLESVASGILRIDADPATGVNRGALIEESRTNSALYSEQLDNAYIYKAGVTISANAAIGPDGNQTLDKIVSTATTGNTEVSQQIIGIGAANPVSISAVFKPGGYNFVRLAFVETSPFTRYAYADFNLSTGVLVRAAAYGGAVIVGTPTIAPLANGCFRCSISGILGGSANGIYHKIILNTGADSFSITGDGVSGVYAGMVQAESGAFPTTYIPTTSAAVTRAQDNLIIPTSSFEYNPNEGTAFIDFFSQNIPFYSYPGLFRFDDSSGTNNNRLGVYAADGSSTVVGFSQTAAATSSMLVTALKGRNRMAMAFRKNDAAISINGGIYSAAAFDMPVGVSRLLIGCQDLVWNDAIARFSYIPRRLDNLTLQRMTS